MKSQNLNIRIDPERLSRFKQAARKAGLTVTEVLTALIESYIENEYRTPQSAPDGLLRRFFSLIRR